MKDNSNYYSVADLVAMKLPGFPVTRQGVDAHVKREGWLCRETKGLGGPGGVKREYQPPAEIQALIDARQHATQATEAGQQLANVLREAERQQGTVFVNVGLLARLLDAVDAVAERKFKNPLPTIMRLGAAISAYRSMPRYGLPEPLDTIAAHALGQDELEAAVTLALYAMNADQFEPGQDDDSISVVSIIEPADLPRPSGH